jgi:outer membrane protein OmpA-like peptidoglycan-associated protein
MGRVAVVFTSVAVVFVAALVTLSWLGYRDLKGMRAEVRTLSAQVNRADRIAQAESAAALAASERAQAAASEAQQAALGRQQAEQQRQAADAKRAQAESAAVQAIFDARKAEDQVAEMRHERAAELDQMQQALSRVVETRRTPNGMVIVLPDAKFRFAFDSAELSEKNRELLSRIAGILLVSKGYGLAIYGYTDDVGSAAYNQQLSLRRAEAVEKYLAQAGIDPSIMSVKGYGKTSPLVPGTTPQARAQNRRVEIALADTSIQYVGEAAQSSAR